MERNAAAWAQILSEKTGDQLIEACEEALGIWPHSTEIWSIYIRASPAPKELFERCLPLSVDPKLYLLYIDFVKTNSPSELAAALEYTLETVSCDPDAGGIWKMYIDFLSNKPVANEWEEQHRLDEVRRAYKRAVSLPLTNVESLWRSYGQFETSVSRQQARKFIDDRSPAYMTARSALKPYSLVTKGLNFSTMQAPATSKSETSKWRHYIAWEQSNPLGLSPGDLALRVKFAYRRATACARWSPALWFDAGEAVGPQFWELGGEAMPESYLLSFKLVEHYERTDKYTEVERVLNRLTECLSNAERDPTPGWAELIRCTHRMKGRDNARAVVKHCFDLVSEPTSSLYIAAAGLEGDNPELVARIWDFAYSQFSRDVNVAERYIEHLFVERKDAVNARAVFEKTVASGPPRRDLWDMMLRFESRFAEQSEANLGALQRLEARYRELWPQQDAVALFIRRYGAVQHLFDEANVSDEDSEKPQSIVPENSVLSRILATLPPRSLYDGPVVDSRKLMQLIVGS